MEIRPWDGRWAEGSEKIPEITAIVVLPPDNQMSRKLDTLQDLELYQPKKP